MGGRQVLRLRNVTNFFQSYLNARQENTEMLEMVALSVLISKLTLKKKFSERLQGGLPANKFHFSMCMD